MKSILNCNKNGSWLKRFILEFLNKYHQIRCGDSNGRYCFSPAASALHCDTAVWTEQEVVLKANTACVLPPAIRSAVSSEGTTSFSSLLWILPPSKGPMSVRRHREIRRFSDNMRDIRQILCASSLSSAYCRGLTGLCSLLWCTGLSGIQFAAAENTHCTLEQYKKSNMNLCVLHGNVCACERAYCRCVVSKCLQVSHIGVDEPPGALNLGADVMVCSIGNKYSHTETHTHIYRISEVDKYSDLYSPGEGSMATFRCISAAWDQKSLTEDSQRHDTGLQSI